MLVPVVALAQPVGQTQWDPSSPLRAADLNRLAARVFQLSKAAAYAAPSVDMPVVFQEFVTAVATCNDADDLLLNCSCQGLLDGQSNRGISIRGVITRQNDLETAAECECQGQHDAADRQQDPRALRAIATCLPLNEAL